MKYDAIIIGAGISGLVCGCYLTKAGMKVLIVEQHNKPGGYFSSFKRDGFLFDAAAHSFGNYREGGHVRKILTEIGIDRIVKIKRFNPSDIVIAPDFKITFWNDIKDTITNLSEIFPQEKNSIINFFDFVTSTNQFEFTKLKNKTFSALLRSFFKNEELINLLALPVFGNGGLPPSLMHAFSGTKIFSDFIVDGGYCSEGGIQNLPNAFENIIKQNGGNILYGKLVKKILCQNNSITGVKLEADEKIMSKYVVSACDITQTFKTLLGRRIVGKQIIDNLECKIPSISTFILYMGIDKPFDGLPQPGTNMWILPYYDVNEMYTQMLKCNFDKVGYMLRVSPDSKTILAFWGAPFKTFYFWKKNKNKIAEKFINTIKNFIPSIREHIVYFDAASPYTSYKFTLNYKGAAFGWAKMPSQTFDSILSKLTFIKGLYLTGHWTSIAFGLPGSCYTGCDTAKRILRKECIKT